MAFEGLMGDIEKMHMRNAHAAQRTEDFRDHAAVMSERQALRRALAQFDPDHPLLANKKLREAIQAAGERLVGQKGWSWEQVAKAGSDVQYDYTPPPSDPALVKKLGEVEAANLMNLVEKQALRTALRLIDRDHPLVSPNSDGNLVIAALRRAAITAYEFSDHSIEAVAEVGRTFKIPEREAMAAGGRRTSVLESYPGELEALRKRVAFLENPKMQEALRRASEQAKTAPK